MLEPRMDADGRGLRGKVGPGVGMIAAAEAADPGIGRVRSGSGDTLVPLVSVRVGATGTGGGRRGQECPRSGG